MADAKTFHVPRKNHHRKEIVVTRTSQVLRYPLSPCYSRLSKTAWLIQHTLMTFLTAMTVAVMQGLVSAMPNSAMPPAAQMRKALSMSALTYQAAWNELALKFGLVVMAPILTNSNEPMVMR